MLQSVSMASFLGNKSDKKVEGAGLGNAFRKAYKTVETVRVGTGGLVDSTVYGGVTVAGAYAAASAAKGFWGLAKGTMNLGDLISRPFKTAGSLIAGFGKGVAKAWSQGISIKDVLKAPFTIVKRFVSPKEGALLGRGGRIGALAVGATVFAATLFRTRMKINQARHNVDEKLVKNK